jgi:hypothetical protein
VRRPLALKFSPTSVAGSRFPLTETVVWTTPFCTVARRISVLLAVPLEGPTRSTPATIAPAQAATRTTI